MANKTTLTTDPETEAFKGNQTLEHSIATLTFLEFTKAKGNFETISPNIRVSIDKPIFAENLMLGTQYGKNSKIEHTNIQINYSQRADCVQDHFHGLPTENHAFVDRPGVFEKLEKTFKQGCRIVALKGLGGIGETQIMLRYSYSHRTEYDLVFWLEMDGESTMYDSFRKLAINLGLDVESTKVEGSEIIIANWVRAWLERKKKWLLLLDNADEVVTKTVFKYLPHIGGDIIMTTREDIPQNKVPMILVDKMEKEEALQLLFGTSSIDTVNRESQQFFDAQKIVAELDNIPLVIDLARTYVETTNTSFQTYLEIFIDRKKHTDLLKFNDEDITDDYQHTVTTVWQLSFKQVRSQNPIAVKIMEACAFLHSELIPARLFEQEYSALEIKSILPVLSTTRERCRGAVREAIAVLAKFLFVTRTLKKVEDEEVAITEKSLGAEHPDTAHSLNNLAALYFIRGKYGEAELLYKRALAIREKVLGLEHPSTVTTLNDLARIYKNQGKYDEAELFYQWVLAIREDKRTFDTRYIKNVIMRNHENQLPHRPIDFLLDSSTTPYIDIVKRVGHNATIDSSDALLNPEPHQALLTTKKKYLGINAQGMILILPETFGQNHQSGDNISSLRSLLTCFQILNLRLFPTRVYIATLMRWGGGWGLKAEEGMIVDDFLELEKFNTASFISTQIVELAKTAILCKDECAQIITTIGNVQQALGTLRFYIPLEQHELKILRQALKYYQAIKEMCPFLEAASASTYSRMRKRILSFNGDIDRICNAIESSSRTLEQSFRHTSLYNSNECKTALDQVVNLRSVLTVVWDSAALRILVSPRTGRLYTALHQVTTKILKILERPNELNAVVHTLLPNPKTGSYDRDDRVGVALFVQRELSDEQFASVHRVLQGTKFHGIEQFVDSAGTGGDDSDDSDESDDDDDDDDDDDNVDIGDEELHYSENDSQHFQNNTNENSDFVERSEPKDEEGYGGHESYWSGAPSLGVGCNANGNNGSLSSNPGEGAS